jgi:hypothetical protein
MSPRQTAAMVYAVWPEAAAISESGRLDPEGLLLMTQVIAGRLLLAAIVVIGIIAAIDYTYQRFDFMKRRRMSRQEVRDEVKQQEGDPYIRARLRQIRLERSRKRMMQNVPKSTVVITNPTHYSVALRYDPEVDAAPVCMAKGADEVALRIRETTSIRIGRSSMRLRNVAPCCCARIVVGASINTCLPDSITRTAARNATSVLPKPTSPQIRRSIGRSWERSSITSSIARAWSSVSL